MGNFRRPNPAAAGVAATVKGKSASFARIAKRERPSLTPQRPDDYRVLNPQRQQWQTEAWNLYEAVGELGEALDMTSEFVAAGRLVVKRQTPEGDVHVLGARIVDEEGKEIEPPKCYARILAILDQVGAIDEGQVEALRLYGLNMLVAGEGHIIARRLDMADPEQVPIAPLSATAWALDVVSVNELVVEKKGTLTRFTSGLDAKEVKVEIPDPAPEDTVRVARFWRRSARFADLADCSLRKALPIARRLKKINDTIDAILDSRRYTDLLLVPSGLSFGPGDELEVDSAEETTDEDSFIEALHDHINSPIEDAGDAHEQTPGIVRGEKDELKEMRLLSLARSTDKVLLDMYDKSISALGRSLHMPAEELTGKDGLNHWTGWNIDQNFLVKYVWPLGAGAASFLSDGIFPWILETEHAEQSFDDCLPEEFWLDYEGTALGVKPDQSKTALDYAEAGMIADQAVRTAGGFTEEDAPTEADKRRRSAVLLAATSATMAVAVADELGWDPADLAQRIIAAQAYKLDAAAPAPAPAAQDVAPPDGEQAPPEQA